MGRSLTAALLGLCLLAPAAHADAFDRVFSEYQSTGRVDPCAHSEGDLEQARDDVPNDIEAYAPDFPNALDAAIEARAGGACDQAAATPGDNGGAAGPTATTPGVTPPTEPEAPGATVTPEPTPAATPAPSVSDQAIARTAQAQRTSEAGTPAPVVALGVLGALLALGGLAYGLAHWLAWDPRWARRLRFAVAEAGWRAGSTWSEFADWVRFGR
jgi:hypothetical protein